MVDYVTSHTSVHQRFSYHHDLASLRLRPLHTRASPCVERETRLRIHKGDLYSSCLSHRLAGNRRACIFIHPFQRMWHWDLTVKPSDRKPRDQSTRCSKAYPLFTEPITAYEQVSAGDHLSNRSMLHVREPHRRHGVDDSTDSRVPVLARVHHFDTRKLDADIQQEQGLGGVELTTGQGSTPGNLSRHAPGQRKSRFL